MIMSADRFLALAGLFLGIPGVISLFYNDHIAVGILVATLATLIAIIWYWLNKPPFTILSIEKKLIVHDASGDTATLFRNQKTRANHKGLTEFWCRSISADGSISNILINEESPQETRKEAGDTHACVRFKKPKHAGEEFNLVISYELKDAFHASTESLIHIVSTETKYLKLITELPSERIAKDARVYLRYGGETNKELPRPIIFGNKIESEIKRPQLGAEYCLEWDW